MQTDRQQHTGELKIGGWWEVAPRLLCGPQAGVSTQRKERAVDMERWHRAATEVWLGEA